MLTDEHVATLRKASAVLCGAAYYDEARVINAILAAHNAGTQDEPVAWMYQSEDPLDGGEWFLSDTKPNRRNIRPLYSHPQPMPQTDAARDVMDHETALRGCRILSNIVSAYDEGNHGGRVIHLIGVAKSWIAEIERLDRATGE